MLGLLLPTAAWAQEAPPEEKKQTAEERKAAREARRAENEKRKKEAAGQREAQQKERLEEQKKKQEERMTTLVFPLLKVTDKNAKEIEKKLTDTRGIHKATVDVKKKQVECKLASGGKNTLSGLQKTLKPLKTAIDVRRLMIKHPCRLKLAGPMDGVTFDRKMGHKRNFKNMPAQRLLAALKALPGLTGGKFEGDQTLQVGGDRDTRYTTIAALIARYGSRSKGSGTVTDIEWTGENVGASPEERLKKNGKNGKKGGRKKPAPKDPGGNP
jgi:hypothetical protein